MSLLLTTIEYRDHQTFEENSEHENNQKYSKEDQNFKMT